MTRYQAEWIANQFSDADGWDPDRDEYGISFHATKEAAEKAAIESGKLAGWCEWIAVDEQVQTRHRTWESVRRWTGDFDGLSADCKHYEIDEEESA